MLLRVIDAQYSKLIIISCALIMYLQSVYHVFFIYNIMIYFQSDREQVEYLVILLQTLNREQLMHVE